MSGAFAAGSAVLFADPNLSVPAIYTAPGALPVSLRILRTAATDTVVGSGATFGMQGATASAELQQSDVPVRPIKGALLQFEGVSLVLATPAAPARNGLTWRVMLGV